MRVKKADHGDYGKAHDYLGGHVENVSDGYTKLPMPRGEKSNALMGEAPARHNSTGDAPKRNNLLGKPPRR